MQISIHSENNHQYICNIPDQDIELMPGIVWGNASTPFTPAYWRLACIVNGATFETSRYHLGKSLKEEVIACLLGGHGVTGELGMAAFHHLKKHNISENPLSQSQIEELLSEPLQVGSRICKYRFPRQKAKYIKRAISYLDTYSPPLDSGRSLRDWLISIPGIGLKTASWVARNWLDAQDVAILDIHIHRAGVISGIFQPNDSVAKNYKNMEKAFIELTEAIGVPANVLDNQIWNEMRQAPNTVRRMLINKGVTTGDRCGLPPSNNRSPARNYTLFAAV